jgi:hypothetical protein
MAIYGDSAGIHGTLKENTNENTQKIVDKDK